MSQPKTIDRRSFLTSAVGAWAAVALSACAEDSNNGGTSGTDASGTGGTGGAGAGAGGAGAGGAGASGAGAGGASGAGAGGASGAGAGGAGASGAGAGGASGAGAGGASGAGAGGAGAGGESGTAGGGTGGAAGTGGGTYMCTTETDNGTHSHPVTVPGSDVDRGFQDEPYMLEDGGTGHTHTLELSAYDFFYLQSGMMVSVDSSMDSGHTHPCVVTCTNE